MNANFAKLIRDMANTIALHADALAKAELDESTLYAQVSLIAENAETLKYWVSRDLAPAPVSQHSARTKTS